MSTIPSVGSDTYSPGPNMVCSPEQEKVGTDSIEAIICPVYNDLRIRATVSDRLAKMDDRMDKLTEFMAACHHEVSAAHQATAVALSRLAEHTLVFDRMLRLAERLLQERG